ncbi:MAG: hypothetical protein A2040_15540 [Rhodocyclales bacterium GWA2_65_19]|nr:MAG: hypothetical protein A2040_15540 [Rhodocyclales bacterium GWA2_65_19]
MRFFNRLRTRLLLIVALATLPLLLNALYGYRQERLAATANAEPQIRQMLSAALAPEATVLDNLRQVLRIMGNAEELQGSDLGPCNGLADRLLRSQQNFANIGAATLDGKVFCSGVAAVAGIDVGDREWFRQALARRDLSDGQVLADSASGGRSVVFGYPLLDPQGQPRAILFGALHTNWIARIVDEAPVGPGWYVAAHAIDGYVIARRPDAEALAGQLQPGHEVLRLIRTWPGVMVHELAGPDGVRRLYGVAPMAAASGAIYLVIGAPPDLIFADIDARFRQSLLLTLLVGLASFALAWLAIKRDIVGFSSAIGRAMQRVGAGRLDARVESTSAVVELQSISEGFNRMVQQIDTLDTQHRVDTAALRQLNTVLDAVINSGDAVIYVFDLAGRCLLANQSFARMVGSTPERMLGQVRSEFLPIETARQHGDNDRQVAASGKAVTLEEEVALPGDAKQTYLSVKFPLRNEAGAVYAVGGISTDISERKKLEIERRLAAMVFDASAEAIIVTDARRRILQVNPRFSEITGYAPAEVIGRKPGLLNAGVQGTAFYAGAWARLKAEGAWQGEITSRRQDGSLYPAWLSISAVRDAGGAVAYYIGLFSDLTQRKALDQKVRQLLNFDALTGLPNRTLFLDRMQQALHAAARHKSGVAVFWIDLVRFRVLNDTFGHATGDRVLTEVARRIERVARAGDSTARLSADEFGLLMIGFDRDSDIGLLAQRVLDAIAEPLALDGKRMALGANIGIGVYAKDGGSAEELLKAADVALARAKLAGRDSFRFFAAGMDVDAERRLRLEAELRNALAAGQLSLRYQPQIDLAAGRVCGIEALMRWTHPVLGPVSPVEFIPIAEEAALLPSIGAWALREACRQNKAWLDAGLPPLPMAVNLSPRQFRQPDLADRIESLLAETGLPPALLELELTESAFVGDVVEAAAIVQRLKALGLRLALGGFGTGYSSLSSLSGFPFDKIKIDQSFVRDITTNPANAAIVTASIAMARSLDLVALAEGVETDAQMNFLRTRQCEAIQGYLFSEALPAADLTALLVAGRGLKVGAGGTAQQQILLLVDDEPNILSALKRLLRRDGYEILTAEGPQAAFELLARHAVQVIVSDQRMPEMNGTEFLERAKRLYPNTVRIILSGYTDIDSITEAINRGAIYHFLTKPWDDDTLRAQVREAFRVAQGFARA